MNWIINKAVAFIDINSLTKLLIDYSDCNYLLISIKEQFTNKYDFKMLLLYIDCTKVKLSN